MNNYPLNNGGKILWFDTETTGITSNRALVQMAGIVEIAGEVKEEFNITCKPFRDSTVEVMALQTIGKSFEEIMAYQDPQLAMFQLERILGKYIAKTDKNDKFIMAGHNVHFDFEGLIEFYNKCGNKYLGSWIKFGDLLCTLRLYSALKVVGKVPQLENLKLATLAQHFQIPLDAHDALNDIRATRQIGNILLDMIK